MTGKRLRRAAVGQAPDRSECDRILVVDDDRAVRSVLTRLLTADGYEVATAGNAREALTLLAGYEFALLLSDINMPGGSGLELIRAVAAAYPEIAAVMMTGVDDPHLAVEAFELGAYGYLLKPFEGLEIEIQVAEALQRRRLEREARRRNTELERLVAEQTAHIHDGYEETIRRFAAAIELRNQETGDHVERVGTMCALVAAELGWDEERSHALQLASVLHDVGKIAVADRLLLKAGPLTLEERGQMERHTTIGFRILGGSSSELLTLAAQVALHHHERFDGLGYPHGLSGEQIPLEARIVSVVDVFDALTSNRPYRLAFTLEAALGVLRDGCGSQFDAEVVSAFERILPNVLGLWHSAGDDTRVAS